MIACWCGYPSTECPEHAGLTVPASRWTRRSIFLGLGALMVARAAAPLLKLLPEVTHPTVLELEMDALELDQSYFRTSMLLYGKSMVEMLKENLPPFVGPVHARFRVVRPSDVVLDVGDTLLINDRKYLLTSVKEVV